MHTTFWLETLKGRGHLEDPDIAGRTILKQILRKSGVTMQTGVIWFRTVTHGGLFEHCPELLGSIGGGELCCLAEHIIIFPRTVLLGVTYAH